MAATAVGTASACTSIHTRSSASASLDGVTYDQAFRVTTQAAMDAGFTITTASKEAGLITATRGANRLLAYSDPAINITVLEGETATEIAIASTIGRQIADHGTTADTVRDFCDALRTRQPNATCLFK